MLNKYLILNINLSRSGSADALLILRYSLGLDMGETSWCE